MPACSDRPTDLFTLTHEIAMTETVQPRLREKYKEQSVPSLMKRFGYKNPGIHNLIPSETRRC